MERAIINTIRNRATVVALLLFCLAAFTSCSTETRRLFFDIPPGKTPSAEEQARIDQEQREETLAKLNAAQKPKDAKTLSAATADDLPRPEVESMQTWEEVEKALPKDYKGEVDWAAAVRGGQVKPRPGKDPLSRYAAIFQWDFIIQNPKKNVYFPHSAHTAWLGCKNCHTAIYPYRRNPVKMQDVRKGESCGRCHGKVAFSLKACNRCHTKK